MFKNWTLGTAKSKPLSILLLFICVQGITGQRAIAQKSATLPSSLIAQKSPSKAQSLPAICSAQLGGAIDAVINRPQFQRFRWGILVEPVSGSGTLYARDRDRYFIPASNTKLFTTAAALSKLGSNYRIRTSIYNASSDPNIKSLRLVGRGDPSLTDTQLRELAQQLKRQGYDQIQQLVVDDGYFQGTQINPSWEWEDVQYYYGTTVNSLILNQNAIGLTISPQKPGLPLKVSWNDPISAISWQVENNSVTSAPGSESSVQLNSFLGKPVLQISGQLAADAQPNLQAMAVIDPAETFSRHLRVALAGQQIKVANTQVVATKNTDNGKELAAVESPPLATLLAETNQSSNNLYAEALLRLLGATNKELAANNQDTAKIGLATVKQTLTNLGVDPESYKLVDGSGLSRHNLVSPNAIVQTLKAMAKSPYAEYYRASLPIAGVSGTLKTRLRNTPAQGMLLAKTGTMTGVVALSGYLNAPINQPLVFSILVNQSDQSASVMRQAMDEIVLLLTRVRTC